MINIDEALNLVLSNLPERHVEPIDFRSALGRVLAENLVATSDIPPFRRAAVDGYALRFEDAGTAPARLAYVGEIRAGGGTSIPVGRMETVAIMTGAPVPEGADAVQMVEHSQRSGDGREVVILKPVKLGENIAPRGAEASTGDLVLEHRRVLGPAEIAVLATFGYTRVKVYTRPRVALIATGDELIDADQAPRADQIRNSNAHSLSGQLAQMGLEADYLGIGRDDKEELRRLMEMGLERDVLILTGGVSMGEYDFVKDIFEELGLEIFFTKVRMKPGKPTVFARKGDKLVFGLPGNPVSTFIAFENFVRPAVGRLCGLSRPELPRIQGELLRDMKQTPGRTAFLPAWVSGCENGWTIEPLRWKGSADIIGFSRCNATVIFPADRDNMQAGETVEAMLLPDYSLRNRSGP
jgi:molybdopterin molybdotransferase